MAAESFVSGLSGSRLTSVSHTSTKAILPFNTKSFRGSLDNRVLTSSIKSRIKMLDLSVVFDIPRSNSTSEEFSSTSLVGTTLYLDNKIGNFPMELHKTLMDFIVAFLIEEPKDIIDYAVEHFTSLQERRNARQQVEESDSKRSINVKLDMQTKDTGFALRRASVFSEQIDIEDEIELEDEEKARLSTFGKNFEQINRLMKAMRGCFVFRNVEPEQMARIVELMFPVHVNKGDILMSNEDAATNNFYVVETGTFTIYENGKVIEELHDKGTIGEITLLHKVTDVPTVKATTDGFLWGMDRVSFKNVMQKHIYKQQKMFDELLKSVKMFEVLNQYERLKLIEALVPKTYIPGATIIKQGDEPDGMYFIEDGHCSVYLDQQKGKGEVIVNKLTKGDYFGELALLTGDKRKASVYAETAVKVAFIDKDSFERLLGKCVDILNRGMEDYNLKDIKLVTYLETQRTKLDIPEAQGTRQSLE